MNGEGRIRVGTSGWVFKEWRGAFYPEGLPQTQWLGYFAKKFDTVEVNSTFYHLASAATFERWGQTAPADFLFSVKVDRLITHRKKLRDCGEVLAQFLERAELLRSHLGPILYQLPPHWRVDVERLREFLTLLPAEFHHVLEFRDPSWCTAAVRDLLAANNINWCIHDMPGHDWPAWVTGPVVYIRFHGASTQKYAGSYRLTDLARWAQRMRNHAANGHDVFAYFNNDIHGHAVRNARELLDMLQPAGAGSQE